MKRMRSKTLLPALSTILLAGGAFAEDNLTKLGQFKTTGVTEFTTIAQDAPATNSIRNILRSIELPPGFTIDLYALVPDARHMAMAPQGSLIPVEEESYNHTARAIKVGPDNKLYISLGQPFNVAPPEKLALSNETGIGGIIRMDRIRKLVYRARGIKDAWRGSARRNISDIPTTSPRPAPLCSKTRPSDLVAGG